MNKIKATFFLLLSILTICNAQNSNNSITIGTIDSLHSKELNETRQIWVHVPEPLNPGYAKKKYPVLYLLDGETHFHTVVGMLRHLSTTIGSEICPEMIVVGITNTDRNRDLSPGIPESSEPKPNNFTVFLEKELIPYVDGKYPTEPYRMLVGHSIGGLKAVHTLIYNQSLFNSYLAIDPSLGNYINKWYDKAKVDFANKNLDSKSLFIAMGQTMPKGMDTAAILKDTTGASRHMRAIMGFSKIASAKNKDLQFDWKYYPDESHASVPLIAFYDGIHSIFSWYPIPNLNAIFEPSVNADSAKRIITSHFDKVSQKMNYKVLPPQHIINELANYLVFKKMGEKALALYKLNAENYPQSRHAKNSLKLNEFADKKHISELFAAGKSIFEFSKMLKKDKAKGNQSEYNLSELSLNSYGYELMAQHKQDLALAVFKLNVEFYPKSANVYDSLGECLLNMGKEKEGIRAYKKSLELNPKNTNAKRIIEKYADKKN